MIVRDPPSSLRLFFVMQGSVVPAIIGKIVAIALLSVLVLLVDGYIMRLPHISMPAMGCSGWRCRCFWAFATMSPMTAGGRRANYGAR